MQDFQYLIFFFFFCFYDLCMFLSCREVDSVDLRKKLPFCVGLLLRLLRKNHRIFVTCTTGLDRSPACVIAYLHWIQDTALHAAHSFVTGLHSCRSDRYIYLQPSTRKLIYMTDLLGMTWNKLYELWSNLLLWMAHAIWHPALILCK